MPTRPAYQTQLKIDSMTDVITDSRALISVSHAPPIQLDAVSDRKHASARYRCWISAQSSKLLFALNILFLSSQMTALTEFPAGSSLNSNSRTAMPKSVWLVHFPPRERFQEQVTTHVRGLVYRVALLCLQTYSIQSTALIVNSFKSLLC